MCDIVYPLCVPVLERLPHELQLHQLQNARKAASFQQHLREAAGHVQQQVQHLRSAASEWDGRFAILAIYYLVYSKTI